MDVSVSEACCPQCSKPGSAFAPWLEIPVDVKTGRKIDTGRLVWCKDCDVGFMQRPMTAGEIGQAYDIGAYYTHGQTHMPDVPGSLAERVLVKLAYLTDKGRMMDAAWLAELQPGAARILDVGCGAGDFVASLAAPGRQLFGVEPDAKARAVANGKGVTVAEGTAEAMPPEISGQTFDLVLMTHVLEHCADPGRALRNVRAMMAPGGGFYCEVPNCAALHFQTYEEISEMLDVPRHVHFFTPQSLRRMMEEAGLKVEAEVHHGHTRHYLPGWRAWENKVHRRLTENGGARHTPPRGFARDLRLLLREAFAAPDRKYDCIGLFARAPG